MVDPFRNRPKCRATRKDGRPCQSFALENGFCFAHDPHIAEKRAEARRKGGQHSSHVHRFRAILPPRLIPVFERLEAAMEAVENGILTPAQAQALSSLARAMVAVLESSELAERLREIEEIVEARSAKHS